MLKRLIAGGAVVVVGAGIWGVAGEDHTKRDASGSIVAAGQLGAFATKLGDCFESVPTSGGVSTVPGVPCTSAHHWQVIYKGNLTLGNFEVNAVQNASTELCNSAITTIAQNLSQNLATEYQNANTASLIPTAASWDKGDRGVDCLIGSDTQTFYDSLI
jgi:hypothetical protein